MPKHKSKPAEQEAEPLPTGEKAHRMYITGNGKPASPPLGQEHLAPLPPPPPPAPPRDWPYRRDEATMLAWCFALPRLS